MPIMLEDAYEGYIMPPTIKPYTCHCCVCEAADKLGPECMCRRNPDLCGEANDYPDKYKYDTTQAETEEYYGPGCHPLEDKIIGNGLPDSGQRTSFGTGAVRETEAKGRCDLLPWDIIAEMMDDVLAHSFCMAMYHATHGELDEIATALHMFIADAFEDWPTAMLEVSHHYEDGAKKYADRNWEKGIPVNVFLSAAGRHFLKYMRCDDDERHDRAVVWNLLGALWTIKHHPRMVSGDIDKMEGN